MSINVPCRFLQAVKASEDSKMIVLIWSVAEVSSATHPHRVEGQPKECDLGNRAKRRLPS